MMSFFEDPAERRNCAAMGLAQAIFMLMREESVAINIGYTQLKRGYIRDVPIREGQADMLFAIAETDWSKESEQCQRLVGELKTLLKGEK